MQRQRGKSRGNKENAEKIRQSQAKYNKVNAERIKESQSEYNKENREEINEKQRTKRAKAKNLWTQQDRYIAFKDEFREGIVYVCVSCHRALWKNQVQVLLESQIEKLIEKGEKLKNASNQKTFKAFFEEDILRGQKVDDLEHVVFCSNCLKYIKKKQMPRIHVSNGLELEEQPDRD